MRDQPPARELLALARELLAEQLLPLLPEDRWGDAGRILKALSIAEREGVADAEIERVLAEFHAQEAQAPAAPVPAERAADSAGGPGDLLGSFAAQVRAGLAEGNGPEARRARRLMWDMTIARLRESSPRFLAEHGIGSEG